MQEADSAAPEPFADGDAGMTFDSSAESVSAARRLVAAQLDSWNLSELGDDARLIVSELLTNAALHAKPPIRMRLIRIPGGLRLEVSDGSREMPLMVRASTEVMTGRGWRLVQALSQDCGAQRAESGDGKTIWVTLLQEAHGRDAELAAAADNSGSRFVEADLLALFPDHDDDAAARRYQVFLGDVPTDLLLGAKAHIDALIREFALLASGAAGGASPVPIELTQLIQRVVGNFGEARHSIKKQALDASAARQPRTSLVLTLPLAAADAGRAYLTALDEIDSYCRAEQMLTLETPPAHRVFRRWYVEELVAGLAKAADPASPDAAHIPETFEGRLLREYEELSLAHARLLRDAHRVG